MKKLVFIIMIAVLAGCGERLSEGEVISKRYESENTYISYIPMTTFIGKTPITTLMPYTMYDDEDFILQVIGKTEKGKTVTSNWYVSEEKYKNSKVGDYIFKNSSFKINDNHLAMGEAK